MASTLSNLNVLYEDNHLIIINKKVGDIVQGDKTGDTPLSELVKQYIKKKYQKPGNVFLGVVHRLDRPTSGAIIFARTSKSPGALKQNASGKAGQKNLLGRSKKQATKRGRHTCKLPEKEPEETINQRFIIKRQKIVSEPFCTIK